MYLPSAISLLIKNSTGSLHWGRWLPSKNYTFAKLLASYPSLPVDMKIIVIHNFWYDSRQGDNFAVMIKPLMSSNAENNSTWRGVFESGLIIDFPPHLPLTILKIEVTFLMSVHFHYNVSLFQIKSLGKRLRRHQILPKAARPDSLTRFERKLSVRRRNVVRW